jgi:hypothetical protein
LIGLSASIFNGDIAKLPAFACHAEKPTACHRSFTNAINAKLTFRACVVLVRVTRGLALAIHVVDASRLGKARIGVFVFIASTHRHEDFGTIKWSDDAHALATDTNILLVDLAKIIRRAGVVRLARFRKRLASALSRTIRVFAAVLVLGAGLSTLSGGSHTNAAECRLTRVIVCRAVATADRREFVRAFLRNLGANTLPSFVSTHAILWPSAVESSGTRTRLATPYIDV